MVAKSQCPDELNIPAGIPAGAHTIESGSNGNGKWQITRDSAGVIIRVEQTGSKSISVTGSFITLPIEMPDADHKLDAMAVSSASFPTSYRFNPTSLGVQVLVGWVSSFHVLRASTVRWKTVWLKGA